MGVAECQAKISSREFAEWLVFFRGDPPEVYRGDLRIALLDWHLHHILAGKQTAALRRLRVSDLMVRFDSRRPPAPSDYNAKKRAWLAAAGVYR